MNSNGIWVTVIWFVTLALLLGASKWIKRVTKNDLFWYIAMPIWIAIFLVMKTSWTIVHSLNENEALEDTLFYPMVFLTDFCPFGGFIPPLLAIFPKTRKYAGYFAIWMFITAHITLFELAFEAPDPSQQNLAEYIFVGGEYGINGQHFSAFYFMSHYVMMIIAVLLLIDLDKTKVNWKWYLYNCIVMASYLVYVLIIKYLLLAFGVNLDHNVTGMSAYDWGPHGQYGMGADILGMHSFPGVMFVGFTIITAVNAGLFWLYFVIKHFNEFKFTKKPKKNIIKKH